MEITADFFKKIFDFIPACIYFKDTECKYVWASKFMNDPTGKKHFDVAGLTDFDILDDEDEAQRAYDTTKKVLETGKGVSFINDFSKPEKPIFFEIKMEPVFDDGKIIGVIGQMNDITERILLEKKLKSFSYTDALTGLYNRNYYNFWKESEYNENLFPIFIIVADCDGLKKINDTYGHQSGDEYLHLCSSVFRIGLPEKAVKIRTGGDEFLFIIPNTYEKEGFEIINHMEDIAKYIALKKHKVSISYGSSTINDTSENIDEKIKDADMKMYAAKEIHHKDMENEK